MMSKLLALIGSGLLLSAAGYASLWAAQVMQSLPAPPALPQVSETGAGAVARILPSGRNPRPAIYYQAITQRPVFSPTRRPLEAVVAAPEPEPVIEAPEPVISTPVAAPPAPPQLRLLGVIGSAGALSALISNAGGDPAWLPKGSIIEGWTITDIGPDWAELGLDSQNFRIEMYEQ